MARFTANAFAPVLASLVAAAAGCGSGSGAAQQSGVARGGGRSVPAGPPSVAAADRGRSRDALGNRVRESGRYAGIHSSERENAKEPKGDITQALFGLGQPSDGPFPADRFTVVDPSQNTCERINLAKPDCALEPSECIERALLNELDGFNTRPRLTIPFSGPIDLSTVDSTTIFLVSLGTTLTDGVPHCLVPPVGEDEGEDDDDVVPPADAGWVVGIDQAVWNPINNTLHVEAAEVLDQHTRYALIVTTGLKDAAGESVAASKDFKRAIGGDEDDDDQPAITDPAVLAYRAALRRAIHEVRFFGVRRHDVVAASVFTTMSVTAVLEKIRDQVNASATPVAAQFNIGTGGAPAVFDVDKITALIFNRQMKTTGPLISLNITANNLPLLRVIPGAVKTLAYGRFQSPSYLNTDTSMAPVATYSGTPTVLSTNDVYFNVMLPSGTPPAGGWPVVIYGHGGGENLNGSPLKVAADFASHGIATISFNQVGFGLGPASTFTIVQTGSPAITFPLAGRAYDLNGDGNFDNNEGALNVGHKRILFSRDPNRQNVADIIQLIRVLEVGMDVDGDGLRDIDPSRVYFSGLSAGAILGMLVAAVEPRIKATVLSSVDGWYVSWIAPGSRGLVGTILRDRVPSLINPAGAPVITSLGGLPVLQPFFNENTPARGNAPLVNDVPGAIELQEFFDRVEWLEGNHSAGAFAKHVRLQPLPGVPVRPILLQEARGDRSHVNPSVAEGIRAGLLADVVTLYRHDLFAQRLTPLDPLTFLFDPHTFVIRIDTALMKSIALQAQDQIADFFNTDGTHVLDPDGSGPLFEVPAITIPETYGFIIR